MSRTRGASAGYAQLDRWGNPISPAAAYLQGPGKLAGSTVLHGPGAEPVAAQPPIVGYRADAKSWARNMEAHELAQLLDLAFRNPGTLGEGFVVTVTEAEYQRLGGDLKRHFMAVRSSSPQERDSPFFPPREREPQPVEMSQDELMALRTQLTVYGVIVDMRWGIPRLRQELERVRSQQATARPNNPLTG